jgi:hypothetical protein
VFRLTPHKNNPMKTNRSMKTQLRSLITLFCAATSLLIVASPAQGGFIVTLEQVGGNVVAKGSGAIDLTGLTLSPNTFGDIAGLVPNVAFVGTGPAGLNGSLNEYLGFSGPTSFGSSLATFASSGSGDFVGMHGIGLLLLPMGYVSGTALSDTSTYDNATFSSLGATPGTYEWTWGTGANQNFTLEIGAAAVPDTASTLGLLFVSVIALFGLNRFRHVQFA